MPYGDRWSHAIQQVLLNHRHIDELVQVALCEHIASSGQSKTTGGQGRDKKHDKIKQQDHQSDKDKANPKKRKAAKQECHFFRKGRCRRGKDCPFTHDGRPAAQNPGNASADDEDN
jgi:hypothetical protein